jgi:hypothetical protein
MLKGPTNSTGFVVPMHERASPHASSSPLLIATFALVFSTAVILTVVTVSAARAAHLF